MSFDSGPASPTPHELPEAWRKEQEQMFQGVTEGALNEFIAQYDDRFQVRVLDVYDPKQEHGFVLMASATSKTVSSYLISWNPEGQELTRTSISVEDQGRGIGTGLLGVTEDIARKLGARQLIIEAIIPQHFRFWEKQPGFKLDRRACKAYKKLNPSA